MQATQVAPPPLDSRPRSRPKGRSNNVGRCWLGAADTLPTKRRANTNVASARGLILGRTAAPSEAVRFMARFTKINTTNE